MCVGESGADTVCMRAKSNAVKAATLPRIAPEWMEYSLLLAFIGLAAAALFQSAGGFLK